MTVHRTLRLGLAAAALAIISSFALPAPTSWAWDADRREIPCGATHTIPAPFGASFTYDNSAKSAATIYVFTDATHSPTDGHSLRHFLSTTAKGGLTVEVKTTSVVVKSKACPPPPPKPPTPERVYVECNTDPEFTWDPSKGQSAVLKWLTSNRTVAQLIVYLDSKKLLEEGRARVYEITTNPQCHLEIQMDKNSINFWASKKN